MKMVRPQTLRHATAQVLRKGKRSVERASHTNFHLAKVYHSLDLHFSNSLSREQVIVYQMGKVGSSTVIRSLRAMKLDMSVYHVHSLTKEGIGRIEDVYRKNWSSRSGNPTHLWNSHYLAKRVRSGLNGGKWKAITLVRDPVARNISSFFQLIDDEYEFDYRKKAQSMSTGELVEELTQFFLEKHDHDVPLIWYDVELKPVFAIDVFATEFQKSRGYQIYGGESADVLLIRLEDLDRCAAAAFNEYLGIDSFRLMNTNVSTYKYYADAYREFVRKVQLPPDYLDRMYTSKYVRHFYTDEEIDLFRERWCGKDVFVGS